ncbi:MAG TPA: methyltransferase [Gemmatimonadales bacterium]|nr:methyltransferase [Gemmatimonadales bacterium]
MFLGKPWVDRVTAGLAALPFGYVLWVDLGVGHLTIPRIAILFQLSLLILTLLIRVPPVRVTTNPLYWVVALVASYYGFLTASFIGSGRPLAPGWLTDGLSVVGVLLDVFARLHLGRNIGFVPAQRRLVLSGPYRVVRHPIYSALFLAEVCVIFENYSARNFALSLVFLGLFVIKSLMEESFLRQDPRYAQYMREVRYRWIPGLA